MFSCIQLYIKELDNINDERNIAKWDKLMKFYNRKPSLVLRKSKIITKYKFLAAIFFSAYELQFSFVDKDKKNYHCATKRLI
jgi:hypothetical protein